MRHGSASAEDLGFFRGRKQSRFELEVVRKRTQTSERGLGEMGLASSEKEVGESENNQNGKYHTTFWLTIPV